jgi:hypothetical protein
MYDVLINGVDLADLSAAQLAQGWNMAGLTRGPVFNRVQEVLGRIRDMHHVDRQTLAPKPNPRRGTALYAGNASLAYKTYGKRFAELINDPGVQAGLADVALLDAAIHAAAQPEELNFSIRKQNTSGAYVLPIGIPKPGWGKLDPINTLPPQPPSSWPGAQAPGHYYVDSLHPAASDTNNSFGYPNRPRLTVPVVLTAGSYVAISRLNVNTAVNAQGTEDAPVWIVGSGPALIQPAQKGNYLSITNSSYVLVDGLTFDGAGSPDTDGTVAWAIDNAHHISIRNSVIRNMPAPAYDPNRFQSGGAGVYYTPLTAIVAKTGPIHQVVIFGLNWTGNAGGQNLDYESGRHCLQAYGRTDRGHGVEHVWILNNTMHDNAEDGIQLGENSNVADQSLARHFYIGGNRITNNGENAIDLKATDHIVVSQNLMSGYKPTNYRAGAVSGSDGTACVINNDGHGPRHSWWLFNDCLKDTQQNLVFQATFSKIPRLQGRALELVIM